MGEASSVWLGFFELGIEGGSGGEETGDEVEVAGGGVGDGAGVGFGFGFAEGLKNAKPGPEAP